MLLIATTFSNCAAVLSLDEARSIFAITIDFTAHTPAGEVILFKDGSSLCLPTTGEPFKTTCDCDACVKEFGEKVTRLDSELAHKVLNKLEAAR